MFIHYQKSMIINIALITFKMEPIQGLVTFDPFTNPFRLLKIEIIVA